MCSIFFSSCSSCSSNPKHASYDEQKTEFNPLLLVAFSKFYVTFSNINTHNLLFSPLDIMLPFSLFFVCYF